MAATPLYEVVSKRDAYAKHWLMSDGSYQALITLSPQHYQDANGVWQNMSTGFVDSSAVTTPKQPINATLAANGGWVQEGYYTTPYGHLDLRMPKNIKSGYSIGCGSDRLTFIPVGASASPGQPDPNIAYQIDYNDVWNDTDITLYSHADRIKEDIVLKSSNSPTSFTFQLSDGQIDENYTCGCLQIVAPTYTDANGKTGAVTMTQGTDSTGKQTVTLSIDTTGLAFPITVDPTTMDGTMSKVMVLTATSSSWPVPNGDVQEFFNAGGITAQYAANGTYQYGNMIAQFDTSSIGLEATLVAASLNVNGDRYAYIKSGDATSFSGDYYPDPAWSVADYISSPPSGTAFANWSYANWPNAGGQDPANYSMALSNIGNIDQTGSTTLRMASVYTQIPQGEQYFDIYSSNSIGSTYLSVSYEIPPGAPSNINPSGGQTINTTYTISWTAAPAGTTPQSSLQYEIDLSQDNGNTWTTIVGLTSTGATSYTYDFTNTPASSTNLIRIRAYDGTSYGPYAQSAGVFTVKHDSAPTQPSNLSPSGTSVDRTQAITATWKYNDPDTGDSQSKYDVKWSTDGGNTWTEKAGIVTPNTSYTWPANTFARGNVAWMVQTYDTNGLNSPWSAQVQFFAADPASAPTITAPSDGAAVGSANPLIQWSSSGQVGYEIEVRDTDGNVLYDEQHATSTNVAQTLTGYNLANNTSYELAVRIINSDGLWSAWNVVTVNVSYTPPSPAVVQTVPSTGYMAINITNPAPTGDEPEVSYNDVYRRDAGTSDWTRIATNVAANATHADYAIASRKSYDYKITAVGSDGIYTDTVVESVSVTLENIWLHDPADPQSTVYRFRLMEQTRTAQTQYTQTMMQFEGRSLPVADIADQETGQVQVTIDCTKQSGDLDILRALVARQTTLLYRDARGRKIYGVVSLVPETDQVWGTQVQLTLQAVDYEEAV